MHTPTDAYINRRTAEGRTSKQFPRRLESGWGRSSLSANDRNFFGMKCFNNNPGAYASGLGNDGLDFFPSSPLTAALFR